MQVKIRRYRDGELIDEPIDMQGFFKIEVECDGQQFAVSEKDGALEIHSLSGMRLLVELVAANWLAIRERR